MKGSPRHKGILVAITACLVCVIAGGLIFGLLFSRDAKDSTAEDRTKSPEKSTVEATTQTGAESSAAESGGHIVYLETGHGIDDEGKWDQGCSWSDGTTDYEEARLMIPIVKAMATYLKKSGITVYTDAFDENNRNLEETLDYLDEHREVEVFVNIHCDWEEAAPGTMPLYRTDEQLALAKALNEGVHSCVDIPDRGPTYRDDLETLTNKKIHCTAVLFETGSIKADNEILTEKYDDYGRGLAKGLCDYLGVEFRGSE